MSASGSKSVHVTRLIRKLRGGSDPVLVLASDSSQYVVKFSNNLQGQNVLFNESAGTELYQACGLSCPDWKTLLVSSSFLDHNPGAWMETDEGPLRPQPGLCFGSLFMGSGPGRIFEILPGTAFARISNRASLWLAWLVDACANHVDNRQAIFKEDASGALYAFFIDHGHLFGGPSGERRLPIIASRFLDPRIYPDTNKHGLSSVQKGLQSLDTDRLWQRVQTLPEEWKTDSALDGLTRCLHSLSDSRLLRALLDRMSSNIERSTDRFIAPAPLGPIHHPMPLVHGLQPNALGQFPAAC